MTGATETKQTTAVHTGEQVVTITNVTKSFGNKHVLKGVNLVLNKGENLVVLGKSGGGKSVLIKCMVRLITPDSGEVNVLGQDIPKLKYKRLNEVRKRIGFLFQSAALYDSMSVRENLEFPLRNSGKMSKEETDKRVKEALENVNLSEAIDKAPSELSGGMRRRVGIARALIGDPKIVLFDEPTAGLDPPTARTICELAMKLRDLEDVSSIFVTHEMNNLHYICSEYAVVDEDGKVVFECEGERLCLINSKVMMMRNGNVIFSGTDEALRRSEDAYIQRFLRGH